MNLNRETLKNMIMEAIDEISKENIKESEMTKPGSLDSQQGDTAGSAKVTGAELKGAGASVAQTIVKKIFSGVDATMHLGAVREKGPNSPEALQIVAAFARALNVDLSSKGIKADRIAKATKLKTKEG